MLRPFHSLALFLASGSAIALHAQTLVSPLSAATVEGNYDNGVPWGFGAAQETYLQLHSDLRGQTGMFSRISFRRDGVLATNAAFVGRTLTASLWFGGGNIALRSTTFANNYVGATRTQVASNHAYTMPDWTQRPGSAPAAFDFICPLDAPYVWNGQNDFVWEMRIHNKSSLHNVFADAVRTNTSVTDNGRSYATGCTATGQTQPYQLSFETQTAANFSLTWFCTSGVASAGTVLMVGTQPTATPIPGLCANLLTPPLITLAGAAAASGSFQVGPISIPFAANLVNAHLYSQCGCVDLQRADPIKVAVSNGIDAQFLAAPVLPTARIYEPSTDTALVGFADPSNIVLGSVIRLD